MLLCIKNIKKLSLLFLFSFFFYEKNAIAMDFINSELLSSSSDMENTDGRFLIQSPCFIESVEPT